MAITIDGTTFSNINVKSLRRKVRFKRKYMETTVDGTLKTELVGVYFDYDLIFSQTTDATEYATLWDLLTEATEFHTVIVPKEGGNLTFTAYFDGVQDEIAIERASENFFKGLTAQFIARSPERTP